MPRAMVAFLLAGATFSAPQSTRPVDPTKAILDAFQQHQIVALGEGEHGNQQGHAYRESLVRDPRFTAAVDDIVVEFGSARYQDVIDRFVAGAEVPYEQLRHVWEDTTSTNTVFDLPIYEAFFRAVREANRKSASARQVRVLLADPPVDWTTILMSEDILSWTYRRDAFAADVVRREVLAKGRRALLLFGDGHLFRRGEETVPEWMAVKRKPEEPLVSRLERTHPGAVFSISAPTEADLKQFEADLATWPVPSLATLQGTRLGAAAFGRVYGLEGPEFSGVRLQDQFDALLYLGPPSTITIAELPRSRCADERYMKMRVERMALVPWGRFEIDALRKYCQ